MLFVVGSAAGLLAVALLLVVMPVALAFIDSHAPDLRPQFATLDQLRYPIAILLLTAGLLICHLILPARRAKVLSLLPGVVLTVVVWMGLTIVFTFYLVRFNTLASTYASLSGLFAAMFFLYLSALVLILGGEVNRVLALHRVLRGAEAAAPEE